MEGLQIKQREETQIKYVEEIIKDIKCKKELSVLDDAYIQEKIIDFFSHESNNKIKKNIIDKLSCAKDYKQFCKSKEHDFLVKRIRSNLRKVYGVFIKEDHDKKWLELEKLSKQIKSGDNNSIIESCEKILSMHQSSAERLDSYKLIYDTLFSEKIKATNPNKRYKILDLACGLNPVSTIYIQDKIKSYTAVEISGEDCDFLNRYFKIINIDGKALRKDLTNEDDIKCLKEIKADICFMFKTLDSLEHIKRNITEKILDNISSENIVVSFPIVSIGGKKRIEIIKRSWFEKLIEKYNIYYKFKTENELFYFIRKNL